MSSIHSKRVQFNSFNALSEDTGFKNQAIATYKKIHNL